MKLPQPPTCSDFPGVKMIGRLLPEEKVNTPAFLQLCRLQNFVNSHIDASYFSIILIIHTIDILDIAS